jgi:hypothetical protein
MPHHYKDKKKQRLNSLRKNTDKLSSGAEALFGTKRLCGG